MHKPKHITLDALKTKYAQKIKVELPEQLKAFGTNNSKEQLAELRSYLHKLVGSGESFGYTEITHIARAAESTTTTLLNESKEGLTSNLTDLNTLLARLAQIVDKIEINKPDDQHFGSDLTERQSNTAQQTHAQSSNEQIKQDLTLCVWVVDHDESVATQLSEQLSSFGFDVAYFTSCAEFKQALLSSKPDFVIADVQLKNSSDFYQCAEEHHIDLESLSLIITSAFDDFYARIKAVRNGALTYFQKPINVARVASFIHEYQSKTDEKAERILLIDDDADLSELYKSQLEAAGMEVYNLNDPIKVMSVIQEYQPDLVLIDLYMPGYNGMELATVIRQFDNFASLPIIYISSETDNYRKNKALAIGADEFLSKPVSAEVLVLTLRARVKRARQLNTLISKDSLTGLLKHSAIKEAVGSEIARAYRNKQKLSISMIDIDHFKSINDTYGHAAGDSVIASLATLLTQRVRRTDHLGRYGGEEFMLVMPSCDAQSAYVILEDIRERFSKIEFKMGNASFTCTLSAGFIEVEVGASVPTVDSLVELTDTALYEAKNTGRNRVVESMAT